jgi:hypothetical protein
VREKIMRNILVNIIDEKYFRQQIVSMETEEFTNQAEISQSQGVISHSQAELSQSPPDYTSSYNPDTESSSASSGDSQASSYWMFYDPISVTLFV